MQDSEFLVIGRYECNLMEGKYEQHKVTGMMKRLYVWIVKEKMAEKKTPEFVYA